MQWVLVPCISVDVMSFIFLLQSKRSRRNLRWAEVVPETADWSFSCRTMIKLVYRDFSEVCKGTSNGRQFPMGRRWLKLHQVPFVIFCTSLTVLSADFLLKELFSNWNACTFSSCSQRSSFYLFSLRAFLYVFQLLNQGTSTIHPSTHQPYVHRTVCFGVRCAVW